MGLNLQRRPASIAESSAPVNLTDDYVCRHTRRVEKGVPAAAYDCFARLSVLYIRFAGDPTWTASC
jgi:hypothetical protein